MSEPPADQTPGKASMHPVVLRAVGQRQRFAVARALARKAQLVLAVEPTANLDNKTGAEIVALMRSMQQQHVSLIFSSHDPKALEAADDAVHIQDGRIAAIERRLAAAQART